MEREGPNLRLPSTAKAPSIGALLVAVALAGCLGVAQPAGSEPVGGTVPAGDTSGDGNATTVGTNFTWNVSGGPTYFAVAYKPRTDGHIETEWDVNATWRRTRAYLLSEQVFFGPLEGHTADNGVGGYFEQADSCTDTDAEPTQPEGCPRRNWTATGSVGTGGNLAKGRYLRLFTAYGADRATFGITFDTDVPIEILWTDRGATRLVELRDQDGETTYPQGRAQFNANATRTMNGSYFALLDFVGSSTTHPNFRVDGPRTHRFTWVPNPFCISPPCFGNGYVYSDGMSTAPERMRRAQYAARAGTWEAWGHGGLRYPYGAGFPLWGIVEDPRFVDENGQLNGP